MTASEQPTSRRADRRHQALFASVRAGHLDASRVGRGCQYPTLLAGVPARTLLLVGIAIASLLHAGDWPQWRGPFLNGSAAAATLPATWTLTENLRWNVPLPGPGSSTPVVWGQRLFVTAVRSADNTLLALCLDTRSGAVLWSQEAGASRSANNNTMASPSAVTDGKLVCFTFGTARLRCYDLEGRAVWERDLEKEFGPNALMFGYSSSPLLHEGTLYLPVLRNLQADSYGAAAAPATPSYLIALDLATGATRWRVERPSAALGEAQEAYSTPVPLTRQGRTEILVYGADRLSACAAADGRETWSWEGYNPERVNHWRVVTTPVVGPELVYVAAPKYGPLYALRPPAQDGEPATLVWQHQKLTPDASTPLLYDGRLYVVHDNRRLLVCLDPASGAVHWQGDLGGGGVIRASLTGAAGRIFALFEPGEVVVAKAGDAFAVLHRLQMGSYPARSTLSVADEALFIRTADRLFCVGQ
jgi:outer membrane protein assembly factor BamB